MARFVSCVSLSIISVLLTAGTPPQNSSPLMQGGKEGTGLLSFAFDMTYTGKKIDPQGQVDAFDFDNTAGDGGR